ncbi:MAG: phosphate ABC transporter permease PstA [Actinomycetota bacterium]|nr:phosphate ABC transporter permease PstA [Actinomycetota bacterium]
MSDLELRDPNVVDHAHPGVEGRLRPNDSSLHTTEDPPGTEERVVLRRGETPDALSLVGSAVSAFCLDWLIYERLTPLSGGLGFWICWYMLFLLTYALLTWDSHGSLAARDRIAAVVIVTIGIGLLVPLVLVVGYTVYRGWGALRPHFFTETLRTTGPDSKATEGGGAHAIVGTFEQVGLAMLMSVPLGVATALFLNEIGGRLARPVRLIVDAMSAVPSIVAGLFIYAVFVLGLGGGLSGFAGSLALSVLMLPTVTRTAEVVLRLVPGGLREGSLALGGTEWRMAKLVILPTARAGLVTAVILGVARAVGETAPLLLTIGGNSIMHLNPFHGQQSALPLFVYSQITSSSNASVARAWTGAFVLLAIVLVLFVVARILGGRVPGQTATVRNRLRRRRTPAP